MCWSDRDTNEQENPIILVCFVYPWFVHKHTYKMQCILFLVWCFVDSGIFVFRFTPYKPVFLVYFIINSFSSSVLLCSGGISLTLCVPMSLRCYSYVYIYFHTWTHTHEQIHATHNVWSIGAKEPRKKQRTFLSRRSLQCLWILYGLLLLFLLRCRCTSSKKLWCALGRNEFCFVRCVLILIFLKRCYYAAASAGLPRIVCVSILFWLYTPRTHNAFVYIFPKQIFGFGRSKRWYCRLSLSIAHLCAQHSFFCAYSLRLSK